MRMCTPSLSGDSGLAWQQEGPLRLYQEAVLRGATSALAVHTAEDAEQEAESDECGNKGGHAAQL